MDLRRLELFRRVVEAGSFSRAAAVTGIAQPALSRQIRALEEELGTPLLYRHGRGVVATEAGQRFASAVGPVLEELARIRAETMDARGVPRGRVTVAMPPSVSAALAPPLLRHARAAWPEVSLHLLDGFTGTIHEWLSAGRVDVAVVNPLRRAAALATEPLFAAHLYLASAAGDGAAAALRDPAGEVSLAAAATLPLLLPGPQHGLRRELDAAFAAAGLRPQVESVDALTALKHLVAEGLGHTILAWDAMALELRGGVLTAARLRRPDLLHAFEVATSAERPITAAARAVIGFLHAELRRAAAAGTLRGELPPAHAARASGASAATARSAGITSRPNRSTARSVAAAGRPEKPQ